MQISACRILSLRAEHYCPPVPTHPLATHHPCLQYHDNTGGWGNTTGVARMAGDWPASLEVNQKAGSILIRDLQGHVPAGTYTLQWEGDGIVDIGSFDVQQTRCVALGCGGPGACAFST